jgi:hypothetical protein
MTTVTPSQSSPGETIEAADINTPVNQIAAVVNGNIDDTNVSGISGSKISDGTLTTAKYANDSVTYAKAAAGFAVQVVNVNYATSTTGTTTMPIDDTIPQNTEGNEYMSLAITPKASTNVLIIEAIIHVSNSAANRSFAAALFQDATANALAASASRVETATAIIPMVIKHKMTAGTTSSTTFKVRAGATAAGTTTFNGSGGTRVFGGITVSSMTITEVKV